MAAGTRQHRGVVGNIDHADGERLVEDVRAVEDPRRDLIRLRDIVIEQRAVDDRDIPGRSIGGKAAAGAVDQGIGQHRAGRKVEAVHRPHHRADSGVLRHRAAGQRGAKRDLILRNYSARQVKCGDSRRSGRSRCDAPGPTSFAA